MNDTDENEIVRGLRLHFTQVKNPVLKFINYSTDQTEIVVKGTPDEWREFLGKLIK